MDTPVADESGDLLLGEFARSLDGRFRLSIPAELLGPLQSQSGDFVLVKERPGCMSLWRRHDWSREIEQGIAILRKKYQAGKLAGRQGQAQALGRLLSTRHRTVTIAPRGRLLIPEGFREFLGVEAGGEVMVVGAAVCVELWRPQAWLEYLQRRMPRFRRLFDRLTR